MKPLHGLGLMVLALPLAAWSAPEMGYAQASNYFKKQESPGKFHPLNLLDATSSTVFCTASEDPRSSTLTFGFKEPVTIDEIRVRTGNTAEFEKYGRAQKVSLTTAQGASQFVVNNEPSLQIVALNPPLQGVHFEATIDEAFPGLTGAPICMSDLIFYSNGKALNGRSLKSKLRYDRSRGPMMGTWFAGFEGAPDRSLSLYFDRTFRYAYQPFEAGKEGRTLSGKYDVSGRYLILQPTDEKEKRVWSFTRKPREGGGQTLTFSDKDLPVEMRTEFRDRP